MRLEKKMKEEAPRRAMMMSRRVGRMPKDLTNDIADSEEKRNKKEIKKEEEFDASSWRLTFPPLLLPWIPAQSFGTRIRITYNKIMVPLNYCPGDGHEANPILATFYDIIL